MTGASNRRRFFQQCGCCETPQFKAAGLSRRELMVSGMAAGLSALASPSAALAQAPATTAATPKKIIDVHHHLSAPSLLSELRTHKLGSPPTFNWSVSKSIGDMDKAGVATAMLSFTTPAVSSEWLGDQARTRQLARECNEYAVQLAKDHPGRFGVFANLPMLDTEGSLAEIAYAFDVLKVDGVGILTSYGNKYLGDPLFAPILEELNRRKAVVFTHPTAGTCCRNLVADVPVQTIEFATDTTRTIASLVFSGTAARTRDIRFIFSHAGGTMPYLIERFTELPKLNKAVAPHVPDGVMHELSRFYYDTAQASHPGALSSLTKLFPVSQVLFGTDFPFRTSEEHLKGLESFGLSTADLQLIERDNALKLLPRLKG